jgi:hypothetical protein
MSTDALAFLGRMSVAEKRDLRARLDFELASRHTIEFGRNEKMIWTAVMNKLDFDRMALDTFAKAFTRTKVQACSDKLMRYIDNGCRRETLITVRIRERMVEVIVDCLYHQVARVQHQMPTPKNLYESIDYVDWIVNRSYPGYAKAGLLSKIALAWKD